jgi:glycosyltransferase involved in cell wall biosynthesis
MCEKINIPGVKFVVCGGSKHEEIKKEASSKISFKGDVRDVKAHLSTFDVFGYPLQAEHFGTCEQALGEAMAAGIPPVVMANPSEWFIVDHGVTGLITSNEEAYIKAIEQLYHDKKLRQKLSDNARIAAKYHYASERMINDWEEVFDELTTTGSN